MLHKLIIWLITRVFKTVTFPKTVKFLQDPIFNIFLIVLTFFEQFKLDISYSLALNQIPKVLKLPLFHLIPKVLSQSSTGFKGIASVLSLLIFRPEHNVNFSNKSKAFFNDLMSCVKSVVSSAS